ncbi:MAG: hypothetical protein E4H33_03310 [Anaerolineales bacterium]|nr:MAG: hypothetical protein E4H33_03310 [Anaerolineales bacterium]
MSDKTRPDDFENQWQTKLSRGINAAAGEEAGILALAGGDKLTDQNTSQEKLDWTCDMLERLDEITDEKTRQEILLGCACQYPRAELQDAKGVFQETGDVDQVIDLLQAKFEDFLREDLELEEDLVLEVIDKGWGVAGIRKGNQIISTKIPKSGYLVDYFKEGDPAEKRRLYCHCPRVRDEVGGQPQLPEVYCYCGAGFYKGIWQEILGEPVQVEVLESVMQGDDVCKIAIHLPDGIAWET